MDRGVRGTSDGVAAHCEPGHPVEWVARRVKGYGGLEVVEHGYLEKPYGGHPAGTPYVDISAECAMDREKAEQVFGPYAGLPEMAWEFGWHARWLPNRQRVTELRLFPRSRS